MTTPPSRAWRLAGATTRPPHDTPSGGDRLATIWRSLGDHLAIPCTATTILPLCRGGAGPGITSSTTTMETIMRRLVLAATALAAMAMAGVASNAQAQTLRMMKSLDAPHYDGQRTTWSPSSDIVNMFQDTLVALDWDGKTVLPYLAKSWTISEDGKTYTFKLRDDVQFCSGKKFTADDVIYSIRRLLDPETKAPLKWRAGNVKDLRAPDPYTLEYELNEPYADLLMNLVSFTMAIHNKDSVEKLGKDYGVQGIDGTGPWCFESWQPRTEIVLKRHDAYKWGPSMYQNKGPVKFERLVIKIVPEDSARVAAMMGGQFDITHQIPLQFIQQVKNAPMLQVQEAKPNFQLMYYGYKTSRPMVSDPRVREAMNIAINRAEIVKGIMLGNATPAYTFIEPETLDFDPATKGIIKEDIERAKKLLDEAGWKPGADGFREKDGVRLAPKVLFTQVSYFPRVSEAIQGYMRKIGVDWNIIGYDSTIAPAKMAEQDYELWTVTFPYMSAGDLLNFYFDSANIPAPNRMNWKDAQTDEWLKLGRASLTDADRAKYYGLVQKRVTEQHLWMPVMNVAMYTTSNRKLKGVRPHMLYQNTFYKGLDYAF
jgi:peptide/nickel transport system substrate-binding protein